MVEYNADGYDDLRQYIYDNYNWLAILNDSGTELLRWDLLSNSNVTVDSDATSNPIQYSITITGQDIVDAGGSLPQTLASQEIHKTAGSSTPFGSDVLRDSTGTERSATLEATSDEVTVVFEQQAPQI